MRQASIRVAVGLALAAYAFVLLRHTSFAVGGADSSGYMNEARMIAAGRARLPITMLRTLRLGGDWAEMFTPLGFVPDPRHAAMMVPSYPPGLPLLFAAAASAGGWSKAPFLVVPVVAIICVLLQYALAREMGLEKSWSLGAAAILAACPIFVFMGIQPMSDVVAAALAVAAVVCASSSERNRVLALICGAAFAAGICVRPTNLLLAVPLGFAFRWRWRPMAIAVAGALPIGAALLLWQHTLYGSPFRTGYGGFGGILEWQNLSTHLPHYSYWLAAQLTPLIFPGGLLVSFDRRVDRPRRAMLASWFLLFFAFYCFYGPYETWWYTRFLLPAIPPLIIGFLLFVRDLRPHRGIALLLVAGIVIAAIREGRVVHALEHGESIYPRAIQWAEERLPNDAIVVSMQMSGAFLYYSGRPTVRWEFFDRDRFELLRAYTGVANLKWYAFLSGFETADMQKNMPGKWTPVDRVQDITLWRLEE